MAPLGLTRSWHRRGSLEDALRPSIVGGSFEAALQPSMVRRSSSALNVQSQEAPSLTDQPSPNTVKDRIFGLLRGFIGYGEHFATEYEV